MRQRARPPSERPPDHHWLPGNLARLNHRTYNAATFESRAYCCIARKTLTQNNPPRLVHRTVRQKIELGSSERRNETTINLSPPIHLLFSRHRGRKEDGSEEKGLSSFRFSSHCFRV